MKVLKFGGTSVSSVETVKNISAILKRTTEKQIVVCSALSKVTNMLTEAGDKAAAGDISYREISAQIEKRHYEFIDALIEPTQQNDLKGKIHSYITRLDKVLESIYFLNELSERAYYIIVSFGERMSNDIIFRYLQIHNGNVDYLDSSQIIITRPVGGKEHVNRTVTYENIRKNWNPNADITVAPGFISKSEKGYATTLGRGGSDYTAALYAAALDASMLEIWTDVSGIYTSDPRKVENAYPLDKVSYREALELSNFGAKVIYPPTIYPVCVKNIPIKVKNTFNPDAEGTEIKEKIEGDHKPIKGISSINGTSLITVTGLSMVGVIGVNQRIFTTLAESGISVFMVSQASSENSTSIGVRDDDVEAAVWVLNKEFEKEIKTGAMFPMKAEKGLATIAIVGENMKRTPGIAGKLFGTLGRSGISIIACAQGASETNISFVVKSEYLRKSLNVIHDSFFLSEYKVLNLFICGVGTVGAKLIEQIRSQYETLKSDSRLLLNVVGIASSKKAIFCRDGIDLSTYKEQLAASEPSDSRKLLKGIVEMNIFNSVFVDCTASKDVAMLYQSLLEHNVNVVAANKIAASGDYESYQRLKETALKAGVKFRFETNVGAGLPIIGTINDLKNSGDKILKIEAVLSGTLNYIFNALAEDCPLSETVKQALEKGFAEPDPRIDLSGMDVVRKLVILTREAGYRIEQSDVEKHLFIPDDFFEGDVESFWKKLPQLDGEFEARRKELVKKNCRQRFVAKMEVVNDSHNDNAKIKASVGLQEIPLNHSFYELEGSNNIVTLTTQRYRDPMLIQGFGAGAAVTAAGVFANVLSIANI